MSSESVYSLGAVPHPPPEKGHRIGNRVEMHVYSTIFQGRLIKKNYLDNFNSFVLNKYQSVAHASTSIFQGLFKYKVFRSLAFVTKKIWAILNFYSPYKH